jgi:hypothetical protein
LQTSALMKLKKLLFKNENLKDWEREELTAEELELPIDSSDEESVVRILRPTKDEREVVADPEGARRYGQTPAA